MVIMDKLKIGIIGLGRMGAEPSNRLGKLSNGWTPVSHAESIKSIPQLELAAICDVDADKVEKFSKIYDVPLGFTDYKELIKTVKPAAISIATRTNLKEDIINCALQHGVKGIYVEKPLSTSISQCEKILAQVDKFGVKLVYGTQRRGMPFFRKAKELAYSGKFGAINSITFEYGSGMLLWSLPHISDLVTFFTNSTKFESISALCKFKKEYPSDSSFIDEDPIVKTAVIQMENGITALLTPGNGMNIRIHLEQGIININGDGYSIDVFTTGEFKGKFNELNRELAKPSKSGTQELFNDLTQSVLNSTKLSSVSNDEILGGTEILFGIVESGLRNGALVKYEEVRKDLIVTGRFGDLYA
ncbi:MAG: putative dehydrogenase [Aureispira sp.]|jgi:predicted dehydrogenase